MEYALIAPLSCDSMSLASDDTCDAPLIDLRWLTNPTDVESAALAINCGRETFAIQVLTGVLLGKELIPEKKITDDWLSDSVRGYV